MKYSQLFGKTVKSTPSEIKSTSHKLLYKGGFIRQISAGRYALLPLGFLVWQKIYQIIRKEMNLLGAMQITTPTLHPIELWKATSRDKAFGEEMLIVKDHQDATFAIGATAEGLMVELIKKFKPSYKDLPIVIYQFSEKFRDEKRPRGGLLRLREFMMKDAYSFHATEEDLLVWYDKFYKAYQKIIEKMDLKAVPVLADSGAIGGDYNHEFMVTTENGEDAIFLCNKCGYAANKEKAESVFRPFVQKERVLSKKEVEGKGIIGVAKLAKFLKIPVEKTTKTLLYQIDGEMVAVCIRGEYNVNEKKLARYLKAAHLELAGETDIEKLTGAKVGYAGPLNLLKSVRVVWDKTTEGRINFESGANKTNFHSINLNFGVDLEKPKEFVDIREAVAGEVCFKCKKGVLLQKKAIEFGHIFKQDHFYTKAMKGHFVNADGVETPLWMGAYGIGLERAMATIVETHHDEKGILWPKSVSPFNVHLLNLCKDLKKGEQIYKSLSEAKISVLFDERSVSAGEKFADCDLIGIPIRLVVSDKTGEKIEWKERDKKETELLSIDEVVGRLKKSFTKI